MTESDSDTNPVTDDLSCVITLTEHLSENTPTLIQKKSLSKIKRQPLLHKRRKLLSSYQSFPEASHKFGHNREHAA